MGILMVINNRFSKLLPRNLKNDDVHIWFCSLQQPLETVQQLAAALSTDEKERSQRLHFHEHRNYYIAGRGILRCLIAYYTGMAPEQVCFDYTSNGKPFLMNPTGGNQLNFNLSHSGQLVVYVFTLNRRVGVDIEQLRFISEIEQIAVSNFSREEYLELLEVVESAQLKAFFNCWTRKEAFIKAIGDGISFPLDQFTVSLKPGEPAQILNVHGSKKEAASWSMFELPLVDDYAAALAVEGIDCKISCCKLNLVDFVNSVEEPK